MDKLGKAVSRYRKRFKRHTAQSFLRRQERSSVQGIPHLLWRNLKVHYLVQNIPTSPIPYETLSNTLTTPSTSKPEDHLFLLQATSFSIYSPPPSITKRGLLHPSPPSRERGKRPIFPGVMIKSCFFCPNMANVEFNLMTATQDRNMFLKWTDSEKVCKKWRAVKETLN